MASTVSVGIVQPTIRRLSPGRTANWKDRVKINTESRVKIFLQLARILMERKNDEREKNVESFLIFWDSHLGAEGNWKSRARTILFQITSLFKSQSLGWKNGQVSGSKKRESNKNQDDELTAWIFRNTCGARFGSEWQVTLHIYSTVKSKCKVWFKCVFLKRLSVSSFRDLNLGSITVSVLKTKK